MIEIKHKITGKVIHTVDSDSLKGSYLYGADLRGANLRGANLGGAHLEFCKGILSFTGEKHLLIYFKYQNIYYIKIGCMTYEYKDWIKNYKKIGKENNYGTNTELYGDVIKLFSKYEL